MCREIEGAQIEGAQIEGGEIEPRDVEPLPPVERLPDRSRHRAHGKRHRDAGTAHPCRDTSGEIEGETWRTVERLNGCRLRGHCTGR